MNNNVISAVFDSREEAERAVSELRSAGASDQNVSIIARDEGRTTATDGTGEDTGEAAGDATKGALGGAVLGGILGVAALAIPGVGPLAAAGAIASGAIPGAAAIGAGAGAVAGGLSGLLKDHGVDENDAGYYEDRIKQGGTFVSVRDDGGIDGERAREILYRNGGHNSSQARTESTY
jgi:uncharacterized membrane protein